MKIGNLNASRYIAGTEKRVISGANTLNFFLETDAVKCKMKKTKNTWLFALHWGKVLKTKDSTSGSKNYYASDQ